MTATLPASPPRPPRAPKRRRRRVSWVGIAGGLVVVLAAAILWVRIGEVIDQRDATATRAQTAADPVLQLCTERSAVGQALRSDPGNPCGLAQQVAVEPIPGQRGPAGDTGPAGERGPAGESIAGPAGERGEKGDTGDRGPAGESIKGDKGDTGDRGPAGDSVKGDKGDTGDPGPAGPAGPAGPTCPDGTTPQPVLYADGQQGVGCVVTPP